MFYLNYYSWCNHRHTFVITSKRGWILLWIDHQVREKRVGAPFNLRWTPHSDLQLYFRWQRTSTMPGWFSGSSGIHFPPRSCSSSDNSHCAECNGLKRMGTGVSVHFDQSPRMLFPFVPTTCERVKLRSEMSLRMRLPENSVLARIYIEGYQINGWNMSTTLESSWWFGYQWRTEQQRYK